MPLLSVIIPIYNAAAWLNKCISSIQTAIRYAPSDVELVLVNDGSADQSGTLCDQYAAKFPNIHVIHKANGGVASARNAGLSVATGKYIAWVDPDDFVSEEWFEAIRTAINLGEPDIIVMDTIRFGLCGEEPEIYGRSGGYIDRDLFVEDVLRDIRMLSGLPNKVMNAKLFKDVHFDTTLPILEDFAAMPQILKESQTVYYIPQCLYHYRQHESSLLHHITEERAFLSIQIALIRADAVEPQFHCAAVIAVCSQILTFYHNRYIYPDFQPSKDRLRFCKNYICRNLWTVCRDSEVPKSWKFRCWLLSFGIYGIFNRLRRII